MNEGFALAKQQGYAGRYINNASVHFIFDMAGIDFEPEQPTRIPVLARQPAPAIVSKGPSAPPVLEAARSGDFTFDATTVDSQPPARSGRNEMQGEMPDGKSTSSPPSRRIAVPKSRLRTPSIQTASSEPVEELAARTKTHQSLVQFGPELSRPRHADPTISLTEKVARAITHFGVDRVIENVMSRNIAAGPKKAFITGLILLGEGTFPGSQLSAAHPHAPSGRLQITLPLFDMRIKALTAPITWTLNVASGPRLPSHATSSRETRSSVSVPASIANIFQQLAIPAPSPISCARKAVLNRAGALPRRVSRASTSAVNIAIMAFFPPDASSSVVTIDITEQLVDDAMPVQEDIITVRTASQSAIHFEPSSHALGLSAFLPLVPYEPEPIVRQSAVNSVQQQAPDLGVRPNGPSFLSLLPLLGQSSSPPTTPNNQPPSCTCAMCKLATDAEGDDVDPPLNLRQLIGVGDFGGDAFIPMIEAELEAAVQLSLAQTPSIIVVGGTELNLVSPAEDALEADFNAHVAVVYPQEISKRQRKAMFKRQDPSEAAPPVLDASRKFPHKSPKLSVLPGPQTSRMWCRPHLLVASLWSSPQFNWRGSRRLSRKIRQHAVCRALSLRLPTHSPSSHWKYEAFPRHRV